MHAGWMLANACSNRRPKLAKSQPAAVQMGGQTPVQALDRRRRVEEEEPWSFLHSSQLDRYFGHSWTGDAGWRRDWVHKRCGIGGGIERDRCGIAVNPAAIPHFDPAPALRHLDYTQTGLCALKAHATVEWMSAVFIVLDTPAYPGGEAFRIAGL